jgi:hypothetical protein
VLLALVSDKMFNKECDENILRKCDESWDMEIVTAEKKK